MTRIEALTSRIYRKTVGESGSGGQLYLPRDLLGCQVFVLWSPKSVEETLIDDDLMLLTATVEGWEQRAVYERGTTAGFNVGRDRVGDNAIVVPWPARVLIVA